MPNILLNYNTALYNKFKHFFNRSEENKVILVVINEPKPDLQVKMFRHFSFPWSTACSVFV
jgi:hypothetical protein